METNDFGVVDQLKDAVAAMRALGVPEDVLAAELKRLSDADGVIVVSKREARFFPAQSLLTPSRTVDEMLADPQFAKMRRPKFAVRNGERSRLKERAEYEARATQYGEWDSGNLAVWMPAILERLVADGKLTKRPGRDDEMTHNGRPTIYEPVIAPATSVG